MVSLFALCVSDVCPSNIFLINLSPLPHFHLQWLISHISIGIFLNVHILLSFHLKAPHFLRNNCQIPNTGRKPFAILMFSKLEPIDAHWPLILEIRLLNCFHTARHHYILNVGSCRVLRAECCPLISLSDESPCCHQGHLIFSPSWISLWLSAFLNRHGYRLPHPFSCRIFYKLRLNPSQLKDLELQVICDHVSLPGWNVRLFFFQVLKS